jgi:multimeric flavodoxin WrbA
MSRAIAILGSARSDGHTAALLSRLIADTDCELIDLNAARIAAFRYDQQYPADDEFLAIVEKIIAARVTIFATPVYWYSFSAVMKSFIDRLSDLLMAHKPTGRRLRGCRFALLSSGSDNRPDPDLVSTFSRTCAYLGAEFIGSVYGEEGGPFIDDAPAQRIRELLMRPSPV